MNEIRKNYLRNRKHTRTKIKKKYLNKGKKYTEIKIKKNYQNQKSKNL